MVKKKKVKVSSRNKVKKRSRAKAKSSKSLARDLTDFWSRDEGLSASSRQFIGYVMLGVFAVMALLSIRVGLNGDDDVQANYASDLPSFYTSFGNDTTCFHSGPEIKYYGGMFELTTEMSNRVLGFDKTEPGYYKVRHVWIALMGALTMYFLALFVGEIAGLQAALLSIVLMFFTMRFVGHSFFNPKDIPFAAGYMISLYYLYRLLKQMPDPRKSTLVGLAAGIALCFGVRVGGLLVVAYAGLFLGLLFLYSYGIGSVFRDLDKVKKYVVALGVPALAGILVGLLFWPYGLTNPLRNIPDSLEAFSNFQTAIKVLFAGEMVWSSDIPFQYIFTWMGITWPVFSLVGIGLFAGFLRGIWKKYNPIAIMFAGFTFLFPIAYVLIQGSILYDGWRHFLFVYAPAMALVALGWNYLATKLQPNPKLKYAAWGLLALCSIDSVVFLLRNSTVPYVYFNPIIGGVNGANGNYELDYWGASVKQAVEYLGDEEIIAENMQDTVIIGTNFSHAVQIYTKKYQDHVKVNYVRWRQRHGKPWDYSIFVNRFVDGSFIRGGYWPTSKAIESVKVNGTSVCMIEKEDEENLAFRGIDAINKRNWDQAIPLLTQEVEKYPDNELAWVGIGMAYLNKEQPQQAVDPLQKALAITPESQNALNFMGYYNFLSGNPEEAVRFFTKAVELHKTNATAIYYLGRIELLRQDYTEALQYVEQCMNANPNFAECYQLGAEVYQAMGDQANAQRYMNAFNQLRGGR